MSESTESKVFYVGQRVRRTAWPFGSYDTEIPEGTDGTVIDIKNPFGWIRVEFDGVRPNMVAQLAGMTGHLMDHREIEEVEETEQ